MPTMYRETNAIQPRLVRSEMLKTCPQLLSSGAETLATNVYQLTDKFLV